VADQTARFPIRSADIIETMKTFEEKKFEIPDLEGISKKSIEEHLKLYAGYVKNANELVAKGEYDRRFPFEFNGMRNHEIYFSHFVGGPKPVSEALELAKAGMEEWPSYEAWLEKFKALALTRGVGWAMLVYDPTSKRLINHWVDEQHLGQLSQCVPVLALDMWEHSYLFDYTPAQKKDYVEAFFKNLNWKSVEENFLKARG
jgi:superoxide dismutase, Fe-Mn family